MSDIIRYKYIYQTPCGFDNLILQSDGTYLTALCFDCSRDVKKLCGCASENPSVFSDAVKWLDIYFRGEIPSFTPKYRIESLTPFRGRVIDIMLKIPYGKTVTYKNIADEIACEKGTEKMSAQAVGGAVGFNPICIIVPCHRVMGTNGKLTGYGGGIKNKEMLLKLEGMI